MNDSNDLLSNVRDVDVPEVAFSIGPGWWALLLLLTLILLMVWMWFKRHNRLLWQREAQRELDTIRSSANTVSKSQTLASCSALSRKVLLAVDKREKVAALHGTQWLNQLDRVCGRPEFSQGVGQLLVDQPYKPNPTMGQEDLNALLDSMQVLVSAASRYKPTSVDQNQTESLPA